MRAAPLLISWHNDNAPVYSAHFEPHGKGRLATSGGDNHVRLWKVIAEVEERRIEYLCTLERHSQAVNVVRFAPKGEVLATAGDDGTTLLWIPAEAGSHTDFGNDDPEAKEKWRVKHMCRSLGSEIYDLAWSPDAQFIITGSMDNIARIFNASNGQMVRQIAEHNHYIQGVAWDPLNEYVATQSSDRSIQIWNLRNKDGEFTLKQHNRVTRMDVPNRRISASSPVPPDTSSNRPQTVPENAALPPSSPAPAPSIPGTPTSLLPMNPPTAVTHSRRSSIGSSASMRRSASPAPSMPLPAVRPMENSPLPFSGLSFKHTAMYANETYTSFFRRLTFTPDGSLLFTPAGQYKVPHPSVVEGTKTADETINTVYIYTRAGFSKPPIAHLPGHKKPSIAVKCSPVIYSLRSNGIKKAVNITIDTSSGDDAIPPLPAPMMRSSSSQSIVPTTERPSSSAMDPPPTSSTTMPSPKEITRPTSAPRDAKDGDVPMEQGTTVPAFALPYRVVYAVATQDSVLVYDTQQQTPICVVSNLHFATFTDLTWSNDGLTLIMSSSDGFCSTLAFTPGELGQVYTGSVPTLHAHSRHNSSGLTIGVNNSAQASPVPTPTGTVTPSLNRLPSNSFASPAPQAMAQSPTKSRSNSVSSVATQASRAHTSQDFVAAGSPAPTVGTVPSVTALNSSLTLSTPPMTPMSTVSATSSVTGNVLGKRSSGESDQEENKAKKRRIAPTPVSRSNTDT